MIYYIAGPMTGYKHFNFPAFDVAEKELLLNGHEVISPANLDRAVGFDAMNLPEDSDWSKRGDILGGFDLDACIERDIQAVKSCDALYMLKGWDKSTGARAEKSIGEWYGKQIEYQEQPNAMRTFETGATRNTLEDKPDYEGFLSPVVLEIYGKYMDSHRKQADGNLRDSDNWQKGIPQDVYIKSMFRHFMDLWLLHRGKERNCTETGEPLTKQELCCALMFNVMGYLFEEDK